MAKILSLNSVLAGFGAVAALCATSAVQAQAVARTPQVMFDPAAEAPSVPAGLQTACLNAPTDGAPASKTCPVIYYGGYKTWIFSYADNRSSFALVTFDGTGRIVRNVEANGARYIFDVFSDDRGQKLTLVGQAKRSVVINWADLPH